MSSRASGSGASAAAGWALLAALVSSGAALAQADAATNPPLADPVE
jgi:hypothetical protein